MKFLVVGDDATIPELCEAVVHLRGRQLRSVIPSTYDEIGADIDELLEMLKVALAADVVTSPGGAVVPMYPGTPAAGRGLRGPVGGVTVDGSGIGQITGGGAA